MPSAMEMATLGLVRDSGCDHAAIEGDIDRVVACRSVEPSTPSPAPSPVAEPSAPSISTTTPVVRPAEVVDVMCRRRRRRGSDALDIVEVQW